MTWCEHIIRNVDGYYFRKNGLGFFVSEDLDICPALGCHAPRPKEKSMECPHVYESGCGGIEMIKDPTGKEWAIGGTKRPERWTHDPWCGLRTPRPKPKSLANILEELYKTGVEHGKDGSYLNYPSMDAEEEILKHFQQNSTNKD